MISEAPMNLRDLRYFIAVADHLHFGRAADICHVSQPTLSGQIRKLEDQLGVILFERTNKSVTMTPAAEQILPLARASLAQVEEIRRVAQGWRDPLAGKIRLGVIPTLGPYLMPRILGPLRMACPQLELALWEDVTEQLLARLRRHELDMALLASAPDGDDMVTVALFDEPFLMLMPDGHDLAGTGPLGEDQLHAANLLVLADGHCLRDQALSICRSANSSQTDFQATSMETLINMVAAGYGCTLVPALVLSGRPLPVGTATRPLVPGLAGRTVRLVCRERFPRRPLLDTIATVVRGLDLGLGVGEGAAA